MNGRTIARLLPLACVTLALSATEPVDAQFGGLGRRITEGAKKAAGGDADETAKPGANKPVALPTNDPSVIPITDKVLEGFERAMKTELTLRGELRNELEARDAAEKKHAACKQEAAGSPEAQQIIMQLANAPENASTEQMMKMMAQMAQDQEALVLKKCGPVPAPINTAQRLLDIEQKAAAAAGPIR
jgi:hypothetical protein